MLVRTGAIDGVAIRLDCGSLSGVSVPRVSRKGQHTCPGSVGERPNMKKRNGRFSERERAAVYRAIFERRDVRRIFLSAPIPKAVLTRLLKAAHHAGSVGFMQTWDFVIIKDIEIKNAVKELFLQANAAAAARLSE